jgi:hypothetical protein
VIYYVYHAQIHHHHHHHHHPSRYRPFTACSGSVTCELYESTWTFGRTPWTVDQTDSRPLPTRATQHRKTRTHIHAPTVIRTRDPSAWAAEDSTCLTPSGRWDRRMGKLIYDILLSGLSVCLSVCPGGKETGGKTEVFWGNTCLGAPLLYFPIKLLFVYLASYSRAIPSISLSSLM